LSPVPAADVEFVGDAAADAEFHSFDFESDVFMIPFLSHFQWNVARMKKKQPPR
jgi:hypothetical protein